MSYLAADEYIVAVDYGAYYDVTLTDDDLHRLRDAGVRSVLGYVIWDKIERRDGARDYGYLDEWVGRVKAAGLKPLLSCYDYPPSWYPEHWYLADNSGHILRDRWQARMQTEDTTELVVLSLWQPQARAAHFAFCTEVLQRYTAQALVIPGGPVHGGEMVLPAHTPAYFDATAQLCFARWPGEQPAVDPLSDIRTQSWLAQSLLAFYQEQAALFAAHTGEVWTMFHRAFGYTNHSGAWLLDALHRGIAAETVGAERWGICYTVFRPGVNAPTSPLTDQRLYGIQMLVGAEGPGGLRQNTLRAISNRLRGFVMALYLPYGTTTSSEPWMFEDIKWSLAQWQAAQD